MLHQELLSVLGMAVGNENGPPLCCRSVDEVGETEIEGELSDNLPSALLAYLLLRWVWLSVS